MKHNMDELTKIEKNLQRLTKEIIKIILFYSHSFQPKHLLEDIQNVNIVKKELMIMYRQYWEYEDMEWLINDIISYSNEYQATMYGYVDKFYNIFLRHIRLENILQIEKYIRSLERKKVISQINIFLGLMTVKERNELLQVTNEDFILSLE
jgi:hypothetical protein